MGYFDRISNEAIKVVGERFVLLRAGHRHFEAVHLVMVLLEALVRNEIAKRFNSEKRYAPHWQDDRKQFSELINTLEILKADEVLIQKLRQFNGLRRGLVHKLLLYKSETAIDTDSQVASDLGKELIQMFLVDASVNEQVKQSVLSDRW